MKQIVISSLGVLLLACILLLMLDIRSSSTSDTYKQKHKVFVPDTIPMKLSPEDSIKKIIPIKNDQIWD